MPFKFQILATATLTAVLASDPTLVAAQETIGTIEAKIDGEAREWRALAPDPSGTDYNTSLQMFGPMQTVSIMGFPLDRITMKEIIQIDFAMMSGSLEMIDQNVIYAPDGISRTWTSLEGENLITLENFEVTESEAKVSGRFAGRVCLRETMFTEPDPAQCKDIEGRFESSLPQAPI
jgi:hypothetical protein